ncbi:MAG: NFYB/HAP3 family transcription factor subunit [Candidatus Thermoplasmatota archaeon]|nr:NFYB/HAP3 family transcription factor subunit [Candidatus Thermoplasmatota archaeon]
MKEATLSFRSVHKIMKNSAEDMLVSKDAVELMIKCAADYIRQKTYKAREITLLSKKRIIKKRGLELAI